MVFYSTDKEYLDYWQQIARISFSGDSKIQLHKKHTVYLKKRENTVYVVIPHPTAFGISNKFWIEVGQELKTKRIVPEVIFLDYFFTTGLLRDRQDMHLLSLFLHQFFVIPYLPKIHIQDFHYWVELIYFCKY